MEFCFTKAWLALILGFTDISLVISDDDLYWVFKPVLCIYPIAKELVVHWDHSSSGLEVNGRFCTVLVDRLIQPQTNIVSCLWRGNAKITDVIMKLITGLAKHFIWGFKKK